MAGISTTQKLSPSGTTCSESGKKTPGKRQILPLAGIIRDQGGATAIEYALIIGLAALAIAGGLGAMSELVQQLFALISGSVTDNTPAAS